MARAIYPTKAAAASPRGTAIPLTADNAVVSFEKTIPVPPTYAKAVKWLEKAWGVPARATSWIRNSPGHSKGYALDVAPALPTNLPYAPRFRRDPLLTNRPAILRAMTKNLKDSPPGFLYFVETDHVHVVFAPKSLFKKHKINKAAVFRWAYMKELVYPGSNVDWAKGRPNSDLLPEGLMNKQWPNRAGITLNDPNFINGNAVVTDLLRIHSSIMTPKLTK